MIAKQLPWIDSSNLSSSLQTVHGLYWTTDWTATINYPCRNSPIHFILTGARNFLNDRVMLFWNKLPIEVKTALNLNIFKSDLKMFKSKTKAIGNYITHIKFKELTIYANNNNIPLIMGSDKNGHHTLWNSYKETERGRILFNLIINLEKNRQHPYIHKLKSDKLQGRPGQQLHRL